jgi:hypothetical protein
MFGGSAAHAVMGESEENRGLVIATNKGEVLLACVLGGACEENGEFFRRMAAGQINRGGVIEEGLEEIAGIGFGSLLSTDTGSGLTDVFCWTGEVSGEGVKECVSLDAGSGGTDGAIIDANADGGGECNDAAALFGKPNGTFDYLVVFDEDRYGRTNAVEVVTCAGTGASEFSPGEENPGSEPPPLQSEVTVNTFRGMAAYDLKLYGGLYCCK